MASLLESLNERELANKPWKFPVFSASVNKRVDEEYQGTAVVLNNLRKAITVTHWEEIEPAVNDVMMNLLDNSSESQLFVVTPLKKKQREYFIAHGGIGLLMQLFRPPFLRHRDGRKIPANEVRRKSETWNEILVILREICYAIPAVTDTYFSADQMVFFFTLLHHQSVFDNSMSLLEEILAQREDTFQLSLIPDFYELVQKFSARQLAHFCRLLSLVLFEPEDRHIMDGTHVLHSTELLQLRRNRLSKNCGAVVERNQSLMLDMPGILPRLVHILRVINYGPNLAELINHNMAPQVPITSDILTFFSTTMGVSDWEHFDHLEQAVRQDPSAPGAGGEDAGSPRSARSSRSPDRRGGSSVGDFSTLEDDDINAELLNSFAPAIGADGQLTAAMDMANLVNVMQMARSLGIADMTPMGEQLLFAQTGLQIPAPPQSPPTPPGGILSSLRNSLTGGGASRGLERVHNIPASRARKELQFHAMLLSPHQIELLFVLCTLLSGRRKLAVQDQLAAAGLDAVLLQMFDRMSWGIPPTHPEGGAQVHTHGPNCTCDSAGSPLRVQYLRLIHNFYDRDFLGNANKVLMLSPTERAHVLSERLDSQLDVAATEAEAGLMRKIMNTLMTEPSESVYKFWLSACVENFLRGSGRMTQSLVAQSGVLDHTLRQVISLHSDTSASLQTSFDLLGEIVKCNHTVLAQFDALMSDDDFRDFRKVVLTNLIDSNVLLRSLYLTVDMVSFSYAAFEHNAIAYPSPTSGLAHFGFFINCIGANMEAVAEAAAERMGYLRETWVEFQPTVLSKRALQLQTSSSQLESAKGKGGSGSARQKVSRNSWSALTKSPGRDSHFSRKGIDTSDETQAGNALTTLGTGVLGALKSATKSFLRLSDGNSPTGKVAPFTSELTGEATQIEVVRVTSEGDGYSSSGEYTDCPNAPTNGEAMRSLSGDLSLPVASFSPGKDGRKGAESDAVDVTKAVQEVLLAGSPAKSPLGQHRPEDSRFSSELDKDEAKSAKEEAQPYGVESIHEGCTHEAAVGLLRDAPSPETPENISRIAEFLEEERVHVIVRLMSTVSLTSINHENICCLNTVLLLLLLDHKRGRLSTTLVQARERADEELTLARQQRELGEDNLGTNLGGLLLGLSDGQTGPRGGGGGGGWACCANCQIQASSTTSSARTGDQPERAEDGEAGLQFCGVCAPPPTAEVPLVGDRSNALQAVRSADDGSSKTQGDGGVDDSAQDESEATPLLSGSEVVFRNFRELLWYWQEYYLRRGRDRLSIEFSCHIPFRYWQSVVGLMCRDDGSPTSLLPAPIILPPSPYSRPTPGHPAAFYADLNNVCNV